MFCSLFAATKVLEFFRVRSLDPPSMGKRGTISVSGYFLLVHYNVASVEFPSRTDQEAHVFLLMGCGR